jgi:hypothetical protein
VLVLALQVVWAFVKLLAGVAILAVGLRQLRGDPVHRLTWQLTGYAFILGGASAVVQLGVFAPWAYFAGEGTAVYEGFLRWNPAVTQSRTFLMIGLGLVLCVLPAVRRYPRNPVPVAVGFLAAMMLAGGALGWLEGGFAVVRFFSSTAVTNMLELVMLLSALLIALVAETMDRYLWLAMLVYAIAIGLNVIMYSALAWLGVDGAWSPPPSFLQVCLVLAHATMVFLAARRLQLDRRGVEVGSLLEPARHKAVTVLQ